MKQPFMISHDLALCAEAALAAGDTAWFLELAQGSVIDPRYEMRLSDLMGLSAVLGETIGVSRECGGPVATRAEVNEIRLQAIEEERASPHAPRRLEMGTAHDRLYRAAFAASRHRWYSDALTFWQNVERQRDLTEAAAVVALVAQPTPSPMTKKHLHAVVAAFGYSVSSVSRAEKHNFIAPDAAGLYRVAPELAKLIAWTPPSAADSAPVKSDLPLTLRPPVRTLSGP